MEVHSSLVNKKMTVVATGDSFITRNLPYSATSSCSEISKILKKSEVRFTNLEVTLHNTEGYPSAFSGGTWAMASPSVLEDLQKFGFNMFSWANNHTMDYSHGGLIATKKNLDEQNLTHAGVGENLAEASSPKYLETSSGRVALVSATSTFHDSWIAGEQRPDMIGRPGVNPLRYDTTYYITKEEMKQLKEIEKGTYINAERNLAIKEGFETEAAEDAFILGPFKFKENQYKKTVTTPNSSDIKRLKKSVDEAYRQSDAVIVSIHTHEMKNENKELPPQFLEIAAKAAIDSGADAVVSHGPHILRGIEIYQQKPIFYSLGNFIFHNETITKLPEDFYEKYNLNLTHNVADALDERSHKNTKGLGINPKVWESVIAEWDILDGKVTAINLHPIVLGFELPRHRKGWPQRAKDRSEEILKNLQELSKPYGTIIHIENGIGVIRLNNN